MIRLIRARIDSAALRANLSLLRARAPGARIMAVVKANAYGHGLVGTALALAEADAFAVARIEEAVALRSAGVAQPIVLLEGVVSDEQLTEAAHLQLDLVVHEPGQLALLEAFRGEYRFRLWLKLDSGMNRLGFRPEEFAAAWGRLQTLRTRPLALRVLTHLACADERDPQITDQQLARLAPLLRSVNAEVSIANSAALLARPDTHADWVRPGLALYGVSPFADRTGGEFGLRAAMSLDSTVLAVKTVLSGERVGYTGAWQARRPSRIATVAGGYGDGLLRSLPNGAPVLINGIRAPLAGRVSMDMIGVDVTDLPQVRVGDAVQLWGAALPVEELARAAGTIAYELLCGISQRVPVEMS